MCNACILPSGAGEAGGGDFAVRQEVLGWAGKRGATAALRSIRRLMNCGSVSSPRPEGLRKEMGSGGSAPIWRCFSASFSWRRRKRSASRSGLPMAKASASSRHRKRSCRRAASSVGLLRGAQRRKGPAGAIHGGGLQQAAAQLVCGGIVRLRTAAGFLHAENRGARRFSGAVFRGLARRGLRRGRGGGRSRDECGQRGQGQGGGDQQDGAAHGRLGRDQPVAHQPTDESGRNDGAFAGRQALFDFRHQGQHKSPCAADQAVMGSCELQGAGRIIHARRLAWAGRGWISRGCFLRSGLIWWEFLEDGVGDRGSPLGGSHLPRSASAGPSSP